MIPIHFLICNHYGYILYIGLGITILGCSKSGLKWTAGKKQDANSGLQC